MDIVFIRELKVDTLVGIYDWERRLRQHVILDIEMATDIARAARSDKIEDTLDYKAVAKRVMQFVHDAEFGLVETLAGSDVGTEQLDRFYAWDRQHLVGFYIDPGEVRAPSGNGRFGTNNVALSIDVDGPPSLRHQLDAKRV